MTSKDGLTSGDYFAEAEALLSHARNLIREDGSASGEEATAAHLAQVASAHLAAALYLRDSGTGRDRDRARMFG